MDSANSGSIQSSSGGDEEFDSRPGSSDPLLSFFQSNTAGPATSFYSLPDFTSHHLLPYDPSTTIATAATAVLTNPRTFIPPPSSFSLNTSQIHTNTTLSPSFSSAAMAASTANNPTGAPRGSRKRTRASRRAPTTVLTTDTSNFRAMVQEFTGIPSPPFAPSPLTRSTRFDHRLFSSGSPSSSLPPYLLRPFAQKLNTSNISGSSPSIETTIVGSSSIPVTGGTGLGALHTNDQAHAQTLLNMPNSLLTYQSLLQSQFQPKYDPRSMLHFGSRAAPSMGMSSQYSGPTIAHGLLGSEKLHQSGWLGTGSGSASGSGPRSYMQEPIQMNPVAGAEHATSTQQQRVSTNCKLNYSTVGLSEFVNVSREQDTAVAATRGEGMVDSWLCSSSSDR